MHIIMYERSRIMCILASRIVGRFRWHPAQSSFRRKNNHTTLVRWRNEKFLARLRVCRLLTYYGTILV